MFFKTKVSSVRVTARKDENLVRIYFSKTFSQNLRQIASNLIKSRFRNATFVEFSSFTYLIKPYSNTIILKTPDD